MTREEVIDGLKVVRTIHNGNYAPQIDEAIKLLEQENILDKIRGEIAHTTSRYTICRERGAWGHVEWSDRLIKESEVLQIIDKYKEIEE